MSFRAFYLYLAAAASGGAGMALEMAASRMLLPYYGDSHVVWANLIGLVLLALSLGYWLGGALADRRPAVWPLALALLAAGVWGALLPVWGPGWLRLLQARMPFSDAGYLAGSLLAVTALLAVPMLLLGTAPPYVIRLLVARVEGSGRLAGRVYAVVTVGSMVGTFAPVLWLLPAFGVRSTLLATAAVLVFAGLIGLAIGDSRGPVELRVSTGNGD